MLMPPKKRPPRCPKIYNKEEQAHPIHSRGGLMMIIKGGSKTKFLYIMSNEIPTVSFDDIIFLVFDAENKSNIKSKNTYENPNLRMNNPYTIPQIYMPNRTSSHVQQDCPSRFQSLSWNSLPNISSQRNHRFPSLDESQRNHRFPSLDESQISVQHPPCLPNIGSPPRKLPKRGNPYTIGSNSSLQFQPNFSSSFESDSPPTNYSGSGNTPNRAFRGGEQSPDRQMHNSHPPIVPNDMSPSPLMSSANSSRSPSPSVPILPCQQPPCPSLCFPTYDSHCNTELYYSYDKELAEIRVREEELCKLEEEKRKEAEELNRQVEEVKRQELQIKKKELEIIKKRDDERRREELRRLDCLKEEETRKLEREFEYRQKCLREEHELELELLRRKEKEMVAFEIARFKDPIDELCEITKIDRTFESIEAEFKECNHLNPENEDICRLREEHSETVSNLDAAHNDSYDEKKSSVVNVPVGSILNLRYSGQKKRLRPVKKYEVRTAMFSPEYQSLPSSILKESYIDKNLDLDVNFNIPYKKPYINLEDSFESLKISQLYDSTTDLNHNRIINVDEYNPFIPYLKSSYTDSERNISNSVFRDSGDNSDESTTSVIEEEIDWSDLEFQENDVSSYLQLPEKESKAVPKDMEILAHNYLNEMDDHIIPLEERLKRVQRPFEETSSDESYTTSSEKKRNPKSSKKRKSFF
ncbi:unnamed protein product [Lepeophtheirus salmonis]|uniref:(salmon louse) hypothetical protein n=1 Tax=Lepeophtheirus salmonis TaxID=72036 RepID=A0A7R8CV77_LEPSM|nr:unnamed protein product [Lepeophtheirus salmonis]CAF2940945.1 unnamed protein product [Lepeophtheirus salmonis]